MDHIRIRGGPPVHEQYSRWRGVRVDDEFLQVGDRSYRIVDLRRVREVKGPLPAALRVAVTLIAAQAVVAAVTLAGVAYRNGGPTTQLWLIGLAQLMASAILMMLSAAHWRRPTQLWAEHRGELVHLHEDTDRYELGKVRRAIERAARTHHFRK